MGSVIGYQEAHGSVATFETDVAKKIRKLEVSIEPIQEGTGNPSPDNVRPITGWTAASITHQGKNIAQYWQNAYIGIDGSIKTGSTYAMAKPVFVQNGRPIAVSNTAGDYKGIAVFSDSSLENMIYRLANTAYAYTASQDCYVVCWFNKVYSEYTESDFVDRGVQIEYNYSPTNYEPYSHDEYDIEFPSEARTVYGGTLDVVKGELVVDRAMAIFDGSSDEDWKLQSINSYGIANFVISVNNYIATRSNYGTLANRFIAQDSLIGNTDTEGYLMNTAKSLYIRISSSTANTVDKFKAWLSSNPLQFVYKSISPAVYQIVEHEINTVIGANTIYADTGDTSVIYPKTIAPIETVSNVSLMELRRNIIAAQANDNLYDKWVWKQDKNDFVVRSNTVGFLEGLGNNIYIDQRSDRESNRRTILVKRGMAPFVSYDSVSGGTYTPVKMYPIPIPPDAINVQMSCNQQNLKMGGMFLRLKNGKYEQIKDNSFALELSRPLWNITGNNHFFAPYISREDGTDFTDTLEDVRITFSRNGQWRWTLTSGDIVVYKRNTRWKSAISKMCYNSDSNVNNYLCIAVYDGFCGYWRYDETKLITQAPIPVPPTATKVTVTTTPALQARLMLVKALDDQTQEFVTDNGFKSTPVTMAFDADDNLELAVSLRVNSSASSFTTSTTPTEIVVQFE